MSYIQKYLTSDEEELEFSVNKSWVNYLKELVIGIPFLGGLFALIYINPTDLLTGTERLILLGSTIVLAVLFTISIYLFKGSREYVVTKDRIITKEGILSVEVFEISRDNIESLEIEQSWLGRLLSYGTLEINGTGDEEKRVTNISNPTEFRKALGD